MSSNCVVTSQYTLSFQTYTLSYNIVNCCNGLDHVQPPKCFLFVHVQLMCEVKLKACATRKVLVESTTPHCSFHPVARLVSQSALDDGALSFQALRALKVRVGQRPSSLILFSFCYLVQQDKWTFDTQSDHTLA